MPFKVLDSSGIILMGIVSLLGVYLFFLAFDVYNRGFLRVLFCILGWIVVAFFGILPFLLTIFNQSKEINPWINPLNGLWLLADILAFIIYIKTQDDYDQNESIFNVFVPHICIILVYVVWIFISVGLVSFFNWIFPWLETFFVQNPGLNVFLGIAIAVALYWLVIKNDIDIPFETSRIDNDGDNREKGNYVSISKIMYDIENEMERRWKQARDPYFIGKVQIIGGGIKAAASKTVSISVYGVVNQEECNGIQLNWAEEEVESKIMREVEEVICDVYNNLGALSESWSVQIDLEIQCR